MNIFKFSSKTRVENFFPLFLDLRTEVEELSRTACEFITQVNDCIDNFWDLMNIQKYVLCFKLHAENFYHWIHFWNSHYRSRNVTLFPLLKKKSNFKKVNKLLNIHDRSRIINYVFQISFLLWNVLLNEKLVHSIFSPRIESFPTRLLSHFFFSSLETLVTS